MNDTEGEAISPVDIELQDQDIDNEIEALEKSCEEKEDINDVEPLEVAEGSNQDTDHLISLGSED